MTAAIVTIPSARRFDPVVAVEQARALLVQTSNVGHAKAIGDQGEALALLLRKRGAGLEALTAATEIVIWSRRRIGEITLKMGSRGGPGRGKRSPMLGKLSQLAELGLGAAEVSRCEALARAAESRIVEHVLGIRLKNERLTISGTIAAISAAAGYQSDEWGSPATFMPIARRLLKGPIDVDIASNPKAQKIIRAKTYYTKKTNGLLPQHRWHGRVFGNPPFSRIISEFVAKWIAEHEAGVMRRGVLLVNASTDTAWWESLADRYPVCFTRGRFGFILPNGSTAEGNRVGQCIFGTGIPLAEMRRELADVGTVLRR